MKKLHLFVSEFPLLEWWEYSYNRPVEWHTKCLQCLLFTVCQWKGEIFLQLRCYTASNNHKNSCLNVSVWYKAQWNGQWFLFCRGLCSKARNMLQNHIWPYTSNKLCKRLLSPLETLGIKNLFWLTQFCSRMPFGVRDCTQIEFLQVQRLTSTCLNPPCEVFGLI